MIFRRDYREPFWKGLLHAVIVTVYLFFVSLLAMQLKYLYIGEIGEAIQLAFGLFLTVLSVAVCAWLIFYEPLKKLLHHHFKAATVMLTSTIGWLFIFMIIFVVGLVFTLV
jgi:membrane protease YdiL (CAAX protease family)